MLQIAERTHPLRIVRQEIVNKRAGLRVVSADCSLARVPDVQVSIVEEQDQRIGQTPGPLGNEPVHQLSRHAVESEHLTGDGVRNIEIVVGPKRQAACDNDPGCGIWSRKQSIYELAQAVVTDYPITWSKEDVPDYQPRLAHIHIGYLCLSLGCETRNKCEPSQEHQRYGPVPYHSYLLC